MARPAKFHVGSVYYPARVSAERAIPPCPVHGISLIVDWVDVTTSVFVREYVAGITRCGQCDSALPPPHPGTRVG